MAFCIWNLGQVSLAVKALGKLSKARSLVLLTNEGANL